MVDRNILHKLFKYPNVHNVGEGLKIVNGKQTDQWAIIAFVTKKLPTQKLNNDQIIPIFLSLGKGGTIATDVVECDMPHALGEPQDIAAHRIKQRPVVAGISTSPYSTQGTGTIGSLQIRDKRTGKRIGISNNHVWASQNANPIGKLLQQPGVADKQASLDLEIGKLLRFVPLKLIQISAIPPGAPPENLWNYCDLSMMEFILEDSEYAYDTLEVGSVPGVYEITPSDVQLPKEQKACVVSGRTSGLKATYPIAVNTSGWCQYTSSIAGFFVGNVVTPDGTVGPGDSGSPLIWLNPLGLAGLTYAGTQAGSGWHNPIAQILEKGELEYIASPIPPPPTGKYGPSNANAEYTVVAEVKLPSRITGQLNKNQFVPGETATYTGKLEDADKATGLANRTIGWSDVSESAKRGLAGSGSAVTDAQGKFSIQIPVSNVGAHMLTVTFGGD